MTKFTSLEIGEVGAPNGPVNDQASIDSSGTASFTGGFASYTFVDADTTAAAAAAAGGDAVPGSAATYLKVTVGGTEYVIALFVPG